MRTRLAIFVAAVTFAALAFERTFENPENVDVRIPHSEELNFRDGMKATIRFAGDFAHFGPGKFGNLITKGRDFNGGYSVMIMNDGRLLIDLKGVGPDYRRMDLGLKSGVEYTLEFYELEKMVRVFVNGREQGSYPIARPRDMSGNVEPLRIGGKGHYAWAGKIFEVKLENVKDVPLPPLQYVPPRHQARAEVKWTRPICVEEDRYIGWPSVCRLANGDLLAVFSGDRDSHICPWGKVQLIRSKDGGETWSMPKTIVNGPLDDRDAGIVQMPDGEIVVTYFTSTAFTDPKIMARHPEYRRHWEKIPSELKKTGYYRTTSRDNGETWTTPERMDVSHAPHGPVLAKDGSLMQIGRTFRKFEALGTNSDDQQTVIRFERSTDHGKTWRMLCGELPTAPGENDAPSMFHEPNVVELDDGTLLALVRYHGQNPGLPWKGNGYMRQAMSTNGGRTWSTLTATPMLGLPPHLLKLPDGKIVCVYGRRANLTAGGLGEFACISDDGGRTWDVANEISLAPSHCGDLGYPCSTLLPDGDIVTVYYQQPEAGRKPCLFATKWRVTK